MTDVREHSLFFPRAALIVLLVGLISSAGFRSVFGQETDVPSEVAPVAEATPPPAEPEQTVVEDVVIVPAPYMLRPYRVLVEVTVAADPLLPAATQDLWLSDLRQLLGDRFLECWRLSVEAASGAQGFSATALANLTEEQASEQWLPRSWDKVFQLSIDRRGGEFKISGREWDEVTRTLSAFHEVSVLDRRDMAAGMAELVCAVFRPSGRLETLTEDLIEFQIRGGEFVPGGEEQALFAPGDQLIPCLRYLDRDQVVRRIQLIPWTFLRVDEVHRGRMNLSLSSVFPNPLPAATRRVEVAAIRVRPHLPATDITLIPRRNAQNPLAGFRCDLYDEIPVRGEPLPDRIELVTDREGKVRVPSNPDHPLRYLYVFSGTALLAKVPMIPGIATTAELDVPDDRARLHVEGEVELLQGELIDIVASREVLMARCRAAANASKLDEVDVLLADLAKLPTREQFQARVQTLEIQAVYQAQQQRDRVAEARIKRLCQKIRESADKHLDPFRIADFNREMQSQRPRR